LTEEDEWTHTFTKLPKYDAEGERIEYLVNEESMDNYNTAIEGSTEDGFIITNTRTGKTEVPVEKVWQGAEEDSVTINLLANDEPTEQSLELSAANDWADVFTDLDAFDEEGNPITYAVEEVAIDGYESEITGDATDGF